MGENAEKKLNTEIDKGKAQLGMDGWGERITAAFSEEAFGLYSNCKYLMAAKTRYARIKAKCYEFDVNLHGIDPVIECTYYTRRGEMTLTQMQEIATLIDLKRPIGFKDA